MVKSSDSPQRFNMSKKKGQAAAKSPITPHEGKATVTSTSTSRQRATGSKSLKAIAAPKPHTQVAGAQSPNAVVPLARQVTATGKVRAKKDHASTPKAPNTGARPHASATSIAVSARHDEAGPPRSFGSPTEAVAEVAKLGEDLKVIRAQYREALYRVLVKLYTLARYFQEDDDAWILFCVDPYWHDATVKPRRDRPEDILRFVVRRALDGARKQVNDRVHKYTRSLLPSWEARRPPNEVLALLKKLGIAKAANGLPMKQVGEKPVADSPEKVDQEGSTRDSGDGAASKASDKKVLEGEVLANHRPRFKRRFRLTADWPEGEFPARVKVIRLADGKRQLIVTLGQRN